MHEGRLFAMDPQYFPHDRVREIIDYLKRYNQCFCMFCKYYCSLFVFTRCVWSLCIMKDPSFAYLPVKCYGTCLVRGRRAGHRGSLGPGMLADDAVLVWQKEGAADAD